MMTDRSDRIHYLFNELRRELDKELRDIHYNRSNNRLEVSLGNLTSQVDKLHHTFADLTLEGAAD